MANEDVSLVFIAPSVTTPFRQRHLLRGLTIEPEGDDPGVHRIVGGMFETSVIETDEMARRGRPILTLFSRIFLRVRRRIIQELQAGGHTQVLWYVMQQTQQLRRFGEEWAMQFPDVEEWERMEEELKHAVLTGFSPEEIKQAMREVLSPHDRLEGLTPEELLQGLSPEERRRLKELLDQQEQNPPSTE